MTPVTACEQTHLTEPQQVRSRALTSSSSDSGSELGGGARCTWQVYVDVPGGLNLSVSLPLVIGTIPLHAASTRTSSFSSTCSGLSWLGLSQRPEAPPSYNELEISESHRRSCLQGCDRSEQEELLTYITEFRYLPPPLYSEVDPYPDPVEGTGAPDVRRPDMCPSR
ncbi:hypothetical protein INR49_010388 [Caranx melampygus]|nr:hypothetical protein INR49_010388 [Caranx melampygus]